MPTVHELKAAPLATVIEPAPPLNGRPFWALYQYKHGQRIGMSIARHQDLREWIHDLEKAGYLTGFGWEVRGEPAPPDWPGYPIPDDFTGGVLNEAARAAARLLLTPDDDQNGDDRD